MSTRMVMTSTNEVVTLLPWQASDGCPYDKTRYEQVMKECPVTRKGHRCSIFVVLKSKLRKFE